MKNPNGKCFGVNRVVVNGEEVLNKAILLVDDGRVNDVVVEM